MKFNKSFLIFGLITFLFYSCSNDKYISEQNWQHESGYKMANSDGFSFEKNRIKINNGIIYIDNIQEAKVIGLYRNKTILKIQKIGSDSIGVYIDMIKYKD